jgi:hypothetical protein
MTIALPYAQAFAFLDQLAIYALDSIIVASYTMHTASWQIA